jgi:hypothetical protein
MAIVNGDSFSRRRRGDAVEIPLGSANDQSASSHSPADLRQLAGEPRDLLWKQMVRGIELGRSRRRAD